MDQWKKCQGLVEERFGKCPNTPDELIEFMTVMADMLIESREEIEKMKPAFSSEPENVLH